LALLLALCAICASSAFGEEPPPPTAAPVPTVPDQSQIPSDTQPGITVIQGASALDMLKAVELKATKKKAVAYGKLIGHWQKRLGLHRTHLSVAILRTQSLPYAKWILKVRQTRSHRLHAQYRRWMVVQTKTYLAQIRTWSKALGVSWYDRRLLSAASIERRYNQVRRMYANYEQRWNASFLMRSFECIHSYEGAWDANTGNGYNGGLQMDYGFMSTYGPEYLRSLGTADNWPPAIQVEVAVRAYRSGRGFGPWPNTARYCGLL
jgi:hypothetical protein